MAEETAALDGICNGPGDHVFPQEIMISNFLERIAREYAEDVRVESDDVVDEVILEQMCIETGEVIRHSYVLRCDQDIGRS